MPVPLVLFVLRFSTFLLFSAVLDESLLTFRSCVLSRLAAAAVSEVPQEMGLRGCSSGSTSKNSQCRDASSPNTHAQHSFRSWLLFLRFQKSRLLMHACETRECRLYVLRDGDWALFANSRRELEQVSCVGSVQYYKQAKWISICDSLLLEWKSTVFPWMRVSTYPLQFLDDISQHINL